ncbi:hypothetical protein H9Y04_44910 [Streptomyces sp. TRM66268-LWL]|uniref:Uncharacterized protein n=1 Tax=Streptomyces polyasparticus TaxID=2767826 RepID=A0ABR7SVU7_9ACTN|nr:hypothetical protein [Streptomyces polyasparticus]MBC9719632.1 hypothetical protein [Streptomyces polyasparticus]
MQQPFRLGDLRHVKLAARKAGDPFFEQGLVDESYARTLFCGRGLLFVTHRMAPRPGWRPYLAWFAPTRDGAWFTLLPHATEHADAAAARKAAEALAARMCTGSWQQALGAFAATGRRAAA